MLREIRNSTEPSRRKWLCQARRCLFCLLNLSFNPGHLNARLQHLQRYRFHPKGILSSAGSQLLNSRKVRGPTTLHRHHHLGSNSSSSPPGGRPCSLKQVTINPGIWGRCINPPPQYLLSKCRKLSYARAVCEFASWWKNQILSKRMEKDRGQPPCPSLDSVRLPLALQKRFSAFVQPSTTDRFRTKIIDNELFRLSKTISSKFITQRIGKEKLYSENEAPRERVLFKGFSSPEEVRGLEVSHRPVTVEQVPNPSLFSDGHPSSGQAGPTARDVGNVDRPIRCLPSYPNQSRLPMLSVFSGGGHQVQVPSATIRPDASTVVIHGSSEAAEKVGGKTLSSSFSVPGRLVEPTSVQKNSGRVYSHAGRSVCKARFVSKSTQVGTSARSAHSVPRRDVGSGPGKSLCDARTQRVRTVSRQGNDRSSFISLSVGRDNIGKADRDLSHGPVGQTPPQTVPNGGCKGNQERQRSPSQGHTLPPSPKTSQVLVETYGVGPRDPLPPTSTRTHDVYRRVSDGVGVV